jgi:hypothetical protein
MAGFGSGSVSTPGVCGFLVGVGLEGGVGFGVGLDTLLGPEGAGALWGGGCLGPPGLVIGWCGPGLHRTAPCWGWAVVVGGVSARCLRTA